MKFLFAIMFSLAVVTSVAAQSSSSHDVLLLAESPIALATTALKLPIAEVPTDKFEKSTNLFAYAIAPSFSRWDEDQDHRVDDGWVIWHFTQSPAAIPGLRMDRTSGKFVFRQRIPTGLKILAYAGGGFDAITTDIGLRMGARELILTQNAWINHAILAGMTAAELSFLRHPRNKKTMVAGVVTIAAAHIIIASSNLRQIHKLP